MPGDYLPPMLHRAVLARLDKQLYYCDVGYGGPQPPGPVPLGRGPDGLRGEISRGGLLRGAAREPWWRLERSAGEGAWEKLIEFPEMPLPASYFVPYAFYSARHPDSLFSQKRILNLRTATGEPGADGGRPLTERRNGEAQVTQAGSREELAEMIRQKFGFTFPADAPALGGIRVQADAALRNAQFDFVLPSSKLFSPFPPPQGAEHAKKQGLAKKGSGRGRPARNGAGQMSRARRGEHKKKRPGKRRRKRGMFVTQEAVAGPGWRSGI